MPLILMPALLMPGLCSHADGAAPPLPQPRVAARRELHHRVAGHRRVPRRGPRMLAAYLVIGLGACWATTLFKRCVLGTIVEGRHLFESVSHDDGPPSTSP